MRLLTRRLIAVGSALAAIAVVLAVGALGAGLFRPAPETAAAAWQVAPAGNATTPSRGDCTGGRVVLTFDGGPVTGPQGGGTPLVLATLQKLHLKAVFFVIGTAAVLNPEIVRAEVKDGDSVQNHTWDHGDFTGQTAHGKPMTQAQVKSELQRGAAAIVKAGAPAPTLYRPPFDDVTLADNQVAGSLGERVVMSYGRPGTGIIDSQDWKGKLTGAQIAWNTIHGFTDESGVHIPGLDSGTARTYIVGYHDGLAARVSTPAAESLQPIVRWMNSAHMCGTTNVPNPADGGVLNGAAG